MKINSRFIFVLVLLLLCLSAAGCDVINTVTQTLGINSAPSLPLPDVASTAIIAKRSAKNAATEAIAKVTITAVTAAAPKYATEAANNCNATAEMVRKGDYSKIMAGGHYTGCNFNGQVFFGMNLSKANFNLANLARANFSTANLSQAKLKFANLNQTNFKDANLTQADLTAANLRGADLTGANLSGADLTAAVITKDQLSKVASLTGTILPEELFITPVGGKK